MTDRVSHARSGWPRLFLAWATLLFITACATAPQTRVLTDEPPRDIATRAELTHVPFFPQEDYQCGPAALATVLADLGEPVTADDLISEVYVPARQGSLQAEMRAAARSRGYVSYPLEPELRALLEEVDSGRPVLVMQNLGLDWFPVWHYAVVIGYDLDEREIILRSETIRRHITPMSTFERTWARADHWAQIIVPPDTVPLTAEAVSWVEAVHELEQREQTEAALTGYQAATERWPTFHPAWLALGNLAYAQSDPATAKAAFRQAVTVAPEHWGAWNNLAHSLATTGCREQAAAAAQCAVRLAPENATAQATQDQMEEFADSPKTCTALLPCPVP